MTAVVYQLHELAEEECRFLLSSVPVGRLAFTCHGLQQALPVHFAVRDDEVCIRSLDAAKVASANRGDIVAFEVDSYALTTREGWYVCLVGALPARRRPGRDRRPR